MELFKFKKSIILYILSAILLFSSCKKEKPEDDLKNQASVEVSIGKPQKRKMIEYLDLNANTVYLKQEIVRATFHGFIEKSYKTIGDAVKQGDILFLIKTKEADASDTTNLSFENKNFTGRIKLYARTSGILTELDYQTGDFIAEGEQLAIIVDPQSLKIMLNVPYKNAQKVNINSNYAVRLPDGRTTEAKVIKRIPSIDPANQTESFILELLNHIYIPSNLNVIVKIPLNSVNDAVVLPKTAVLTNETQSEFWVMRLINDSMAVKLNITKGIENDSLVQISQPVIDLNDRFITDGGFGLPDTAKIKEQK
jgi:multidrug efflux pump subunit AcrA (membrane-fusion protein)